ncbi:phosphate ABC transporter, permease protein PstA [Pantoea alhagi]|uniref:Phosphate transport system permease protein PstA n=1 Tax=Pantoea alhagi TaxID=1891675 RepID=A0A1W6B6R4_9GAMM|nr:phosphate ABC transporter permease PstA [Pantoea alhagi]ARJ42798.1 phosphate ABC transporter, permease protein PstA [Pantoea alhagi]
MSALTQNDRWRWLTAGAVTFSLLAFLLLLLLLAWQGLRHFWPQPVTLFTLAQPAAGEAQLLGEVVSTQRLSRQQLIDAGLPQAQQLPEQVTRYLIKTGNRDVSASDFRTLLESDIQRREQPPEVLMLQRRVGGDALGWFAGLYENQQPLTAQNMQRALQERLQQTHQLLEQAERIRRHEMSHITAQLEALEIEALELKASGNDNEQKRSMLMANRAELQRQFVGQAERRASLLQESARNTLMLRDANGQLHRIPLAQIRDAWYPNAMTLVQKWQHFLQQLWHFVAVSSDDSPGEGSAFPAIFGTVLMVLLMSVVVMPLGVVAAVWLHEYADRHALTRLVRIAVVNLAGVPSIVYGVFGLGFYVWLIGGTIDQLFYATSLPNPTFGTPGLLWASLTLALLTLPVVIVATEEGLSRIPASLRHGSLALGATRAETLWHVTLPLALPAMLTGLILAVARAAGETAPLMLVGVVKMAPELPVDGVFPYLHLDRKFMHLGFQIYDLAFQSPNAEADRPLVYATALLLVTIILGLNLTAMALRHRLRERYRSLVQ